MFKLPCKIGKSQFYAIFSLCLYNKLFPSIQVLPLDMDEQNMLITLYVKIHITHKQKITMVSNTFKNLGYTPLVLKIKPRRIVSNQNSSPELQIYAASQTCFFEVVRILQTEKYMCAPFIALRALWKRRLKGCKSQRAWRTPRKQDRLDTTGQKHIWTPTD